MALPPPARKASSSKGVRKTAARKAPARQAVAGKPARAAAASGANASDPDTLQIGARVKHARLLAGIRMRELAQKAGCTESMVSKIESGRVVPSLQMLQRLVAALERDMASFFGSNLNSPGLILRAGERSLVAT